MKRNPEQVKKCLGWDQVENPAIGQIKKIQEWKHERYQEDWDDYYKLVHGSDPGYPNESDKGEYG
ncbi:unnamed protein product [marine sediment metagenome]|uniref:Uncharacterized protein n=1 Tax=marine sediment metagenome TaxID=412755 RepID=X1MB60_9ZZZZ